MTDKCIVDRKTEKNENGFYEDVIRYSDGSIEIRGCWGKKTIINGHVLEETDDGRIRDYPLLTAPDMVPWRRKI